jgi:hypothetical protein
MLSHLQFKLGALSDTALGPSHKKEAKFVLNLEFAWKVENNHDNP